MPRYTENWEAEYHDPISDAEEAKEAKLDAQLNFDIMHEIELCRLDEENEERWASLRKGWEAEGAADSAFYEAQDAKYLRDLNLYLDDLEEQDYAYWSEHL